MNRPKGSRSSADDIAAAQLAAKAQFFTWGAAIAMLVVAVAVLYTPFVFDFVTRGSHQTETKTSLQEAVATGKMTVVDAQRVWDAMHPLEPPLKKEELSPPPSASWSAKSILRLVSLDRLFAREPSSVEQDDKENDQRKAILYSILAGAGGTAAIAVLLFISLIAFIERRSIGAVCTILLLTASALVATFVLYHAHRAILM